MKDKYVASMVLFVTNATITVGAAVYSVQLLAKGVAS